MYYCFICGLEEKQSYIRSSENIIWRKDLNKYICRGCSKTTPTKIPKSEFDVKYWGEKFEGVPTFMRNVFYDDYRSSDLNLEDYIKRTTE